jgi:hypothetical protein
MTSNRPPGDRPTKQREDAQRWTNNSAATRMRKQNVLHDLQTRSTLALRYFLPLLPTPVCIPHLFYRPRVVPPRGFVIVEPFVRTRVLIR